MFTTTNVSPLDLHLDESNPRFRVNVNPSQEDIRKYMIKHEKLLVLANSMTNMNTLLPGERVIIFHDGMKNIVLEGNRRTCVYQMFLNRGLIPNEFRAAFPVAKEDFLSEIADIPVDVVNNRQKAMAFLAARHIVGIEKWSSVSKWKISYEYFKDGSSINQISTRLVMSANMVRTGIRNYKILLRGVDSPVWTKEDKLQLSPLDLKPDKLIRILGLKDTSERIGLYYSDDYDLLSDRYSSETITKFIVLLTKMAFITNEVNTRSTIKDVWDKIVSAIPEFDVPLPKESTPPENPTGTKSNDGKPPIAEGSPTFVGGNKSDGTSTPPTNGGQSGGADTSGNGGKKNVPYFFDGLQFGHLDPNDPRTHGISRVCNEIKNFSSRKLVETFPIAAAFLTRTLIEQSITYYAKTHNVQAQSKLIWDQINNSQRDPQLSDIIKAFNKSLANYVPAQKIRDYFTALFANYNTTANPLNWVVHRPHEFVISPKSLLDLPGNGLLRVINYLLS